MPPVLTRLLIPTSSDHAIILGLTEDPHAPEACVMGEGFDRMPISTTYNNFVRRPAGVIERDFGGRFYVLRVSGRIDDGPSWQLGVYLAHAYLAQDQLWMQGLDPAETRASGRLVVVTGALHPIGMVVGKVGYVAAKIDHALPALRAARAAGEAAFVIVPLANLGDIPAETRATLDDLGVSVHGVSTVSETLSILGIAALAAPEGKAGWQGSPWPGLTAYQPGQGEIFFGRTRDRAAILDRLAGLEARSIGGRRRGFLVVHGRSGVGKSSLVLAGVAGDLTAPDSRGAPWAMVVESFDGSLGDDLVPALCRKIIAALAPADQPDLPDARALEASPGKIADLLDAAGKASLLLVFDQLEQALSGLSRAKATDFARLLDGFGATGRVRLLATLRSNQIELLSLSPELAALFPDDRLYRLEALGLSDLAQIISAPAALAGLRFISPPGEAGLPERLAAEALDSPDSLPLLQLTLTRLYDYASAGEIHSRDYDVMGGLAGAAASWADEAAGLLEQTGVAPEAIDRLLSELVRIDPESGQTLARSPVLRPVTTASPPDEQLRHRIARHLVEMRLLALHTDPQSDIEAGPGARGGRLRLAHEALIRTWPRLEAIVARLRGELQLRDELEAEAEAWQRKGRSSDLLRRGSLGVTLAEEFARSRLVPLSSGAGAYIRAAGQLRRRNRALGWAAVAAVVLVAASILTLDVWRRDQIARREVQLAETRAASEQELTRSLAVSQAANLSEDGRPDSALVLLLDAANWQDQASASTALLAAFDRVLQRAQSETRFAMPAEVRPFVLKQVMWLHDPQSGQLWRAEDASGPVPVARIPGYAQAIGRIRAFNGIVIILLNGDRLDTVGVAADGTVTPLSQVPLSAFNAGTGALELPDLSLRREPEFLIRINQDGFAHIRERIFYDYGQTQHIVVNLRSGEYAVAGAEFTLLLNKDWNSYLWDHELTGGSAEARALGLQMPADTPDDRRYDRARTCFQDYADSPWFEPILMYHTGDHTDFGEPRLNFYQDECSFAGDLAIYSIKIPGSGGDTRLSYVMQIDRFALAYRMEDGSFRTDLPALIEEEVIESGLSLAPRAHMRMSAPMPLFTSMPICANCALI